MAITNEEIRHLAELSSLSLSDEEAEHLSVDLNNIITYISQLDELDTEGVEPTYQCSAQENIWREDEVTEFEAKREDLLSLAAESTDKQIKVPKVL